MSRVLLAVDGGNSKTDLALLGSDGALLGLARGPLSSPHHLGLEGALDVIDRLVEEAVGQAGLTGGNGPVADVAQLLMAGLDFQAEEEELAAGAQRRGWAARTLVGNDTFAVLRAGTERGWGVAVVCGAGINCVGVSPDGEHHRFPALGAITGDWGGGQDVGLEALSAAARSEDGRGPRTRLEQAVPAHFGLPTPRRLGEEVHARRIPQGRLAELAPVVFALAEDDDVAAAIVDRLAGEVVAMARVALRRLGLTDRPVEVLLGGGLLQSGNGRLNSAVVAGLRAEGSDIQVHPAASPPIVGSALLALDEVGAAPAAQHRARAALEAAVRNLDGGGSPDG